MIQKEVLELKKRFKINKASFQRVCGVYVDASKNKQATMNMPFLMLEEEIMHKYLDIAGKTLSGKVGDALLGMDVHGGSREQEEMTKLLLGIKDSHLEDSGLLDAFYDRVIDLYNTPEPYYIVLFYDAYDVISKTNDNAKLDESEIVYEYILCSICPVKLSQPGLEYYADENKVGIRKRDWVIKMPDAGFLYPAFTDRCPDINEVLFYNRKPGEADHLFMDQLFLCNSERTVSEKKSIFSRIIEIAADKESNPEEKIFHLHEKLRAIEEEKDACDRSDEPVTDAEIKDAARAAGFTETVVDEIAKSFNYEFTKQKATAGMLLDEKILEKNKTLKEIEDLKKQVKNLIEENRRLKDKLGE